MQQMKAHLQEIEDHLRKDINRADEPERQAKITKRQFVRAVGVAGAGLVAGVCAPAIVARPAFAQERGTQKLKQRATGQKKEEVTPPEDLMREHGVLDRVLLCYEAAVAKFAAHQDFDPVLVTESAVIIRHFINNYHEKSEEDSVFPRFRAAGQKTDLVATLLQQHEAGRRITQDILRLAPRSRRDDDDRKRLVAGMQSFIAMYRPHAAREDTDLFPTLKDLVSSNEYDAMAEEFEKKEHELFGQDGFERMTQRVGWPARRRSCPGPACGVRNQDDGLPPPRGLRRSRYTKALSLTARSC
jgi:hemerythrin-like domain-containing protein